MAPVPGRPPRADAARNRESLVVAARTALAAPDPAPSLEGIARAAGVGIGTLYRHFPTRQALVEAVYAAELDDVTASASALLHDLPPDAALRAWMDRYALFVAAKRGVLDTMTAGWTTSRPATPHTRERINAVIADLLAAGARDGSLRDDIDADDVTALLLGAFLSAGPTGDPTQVARLLDLLVAAVRPAVAGTPPAPPGQPGS